MRTNRRKLLGRLGAVGATSFLAGCGVTTICGCSPPPERADAMLWHALPGSEIEPLEESLGQYNDENDAEIVQEESGDLRNHVETALASNDGPELYRWIQNWAGDHWDRDFLYDASDDLGVDPASTFADPAVEAITVGGGDAIVGLPVVGETVALLYNEKLVDAPPETFAELERIMARHHDPDHGRYGIAHPMTPYYVSGWLHAAGGYFFRVDENGEGVTGMDLDATKAGMRFVRDRIWPYAPGGEDPESGEVDRETQLRAFRNGDAPFAVDGPWATSDVEAMGVDVGVAPLPTVEGDQPRPYAGTSMWYFSARVGDDEDRKEAALDYAEWIATSEERQRAYADAHGRVPVLDSIDADELSEQVRGFKESYDGGIAMPNHPKMSDVWTPVEEAINDVLFDDADVDARFDRAAAEIRAAWE